MIIIFFNNTSTCRVFRWITPSQYIATSSAQILSSQPITTSSFNFSTYLLHLNQSQQSRVSPVFLISVNFFSRSAYILGTEGVLNKLTSHYMSLCHQCYLWKSANMAENLSICHDSSNSGVNSSFSSTCKIVTQQSCETCGSIRRAESKDPSEGCNCPKFPSDGRSGECCNCYTHNTRKRKRLYSWQRRSKKKQVCSVDESSAEWSKLNGSNFNMSNGPSENLAGKMNDQAQSVELTVDNTSLARSNDDSSSEIKVINATILSSEKSPCSVFDIRGSQGLSCHYSLSEVQYQSTCPQVGPSSYLHLNVSFPAFYSFFYLLLLSLHFIHNGQISIYLIFLYFCS
jgi:hypothetical protein